MASEGQHGHDSSRLDRIEQMMEVLVNEHIDFQREHRQLLTAQVVLTERVEQLREAQKHTDERLNALITIVDNLIRNPPRQIS
jgi:hypothetical protein